jgi:hypothetical protein
MFVVSIAAVLISTPRFEDVTVAAGLPNTLSQGVMSDYGSPAAWFDWDQDGWPDLILGDRSGPTRLFHNEYGALPFTEERPAEIDGLGRASSILPFELSPGGGVSSARPALLFVHREETGRGHYANAPDDVGALRLLVFSPDGAISTLPVARPATWLDVATSGDLDGDGQEDLFLGSYVCGGGAARAKTLFRLERGPLGYRLSSDDPILSPGCFPVPMMTDYHDDGRPVLMVGTDYGTLDTPSFVYSGDGRSEALPGVYAMGIGVSDTNGDLAFDYLLTSIGPDLTLTSERNARDGRLSRRLGISGRSTEWGADGMRFKWGPAYFDTDNDGDEELWITAGLSGLPTAGATVSVLASTVFNPEPNARDSLLDDDVDVGEEAGLVEVTGKRAVVLGDYDRDGRVDALVTGLDARYLYRNVSVGGHWLSLRVPGRVGARYLVTACNRTWIREWSGMQSVAAHDRSIHVGLGDCAGPAEVTVRWPWLGERNLGAFEVDQVHEISDPGSVWVEPMVASPGAVVELRTTLPGVVSVDGVELVEGRGTLVAPPKLGPHRLSVTWDGVPVALSPQLTVAESNQEVLVDPWPVRSGVEASVLAASSATVEAGTNVRASPRAQPNRFVTTSLQAAIRVDGTSVPLLVVEPVSEDSVVDYETVNLDVRVRVGLLDDLGAASPVLSANGDDNDVHVQVGPDRTRLERDVIPFYSGFVPKSREVFVVRVGSDVIGLQGDPTGAGPADPARSKLWVTTPFVRADGQDFVEAVLILRDQAGRLLVPDVTWPLTVAGGTTSGEGWSRIELGQAASAWFSRARVGTVVGPLQVSAGPFSGTVLAMPPDPIAVTAMSSLTIEGDQWVLIPRDRFGQRLGSGLMTEPPFSYVRWGIYTRPVDAVPLELRLSDIITGTHDGTSVAWTVQSPTVEPSEACTAQPGRSDRSHALVILLLILVGWRVGAGRHLGRQRAPPPPCSTPDSRM